MKRRSRYRKGWDDGVAHTLATLAREGGDAVATASALGYGLTTRQRDAWLVIAAHIHRHGTPPSYAEIARALGLAGKSVVAGLVAELEQRGHLRRLRGRARSLELLRWPSDGPAPESFARAGEGAAVPHGRIGVSSLTSPESARRPTAA